MRMFASDTVRDLRSTRNDNDVVTSPWFIAKGDENTPDLDIEDDGVIANLRIRQPVDSLEAIFEALIMDGDIAKAMVVREAIAREEAALKNNNNPFNLPFTDISNEDYAEKFGNTCLSIEEMLDAHRDSDEFPVDEQPTDDDSYDPHTDEEEYYEHLGGYQRLGAFVFTHRGMQSFHDRDSERGSQANEEWVMDDPGEVIQQEFEEEYAAGVLRRLTSWHQRKEQRLSRNRGHRRVQVGVQHTQLIKGPVSEHDLCAWLNDRQVLRRGKRLYWTIPEFRSVSDRSGVREMAIAHTEIGISYENLNWRQKREVRLTGIAAIPYFEQRTVTMYVGGYRQAQEFSSEDRAMWNALTRNQRREALGKKHLSHLDWTDYVEPREIFWSSHTQSWKNQKRSVRQWDNTGGRHRDLKALEDERRRIEAENVPTYSHFDQWVIGIEADLADRRRPWHRAQYENRAAA